MLLFDMLLYEKLRLKLLQIQITRGLDVEDRHRCWAMFPARVAHSLDTVNSNRGSLYLSRQSLYNKMQHDKTGRSINILLEFHSM